MSQKAYNFVKTGQNSTYSWQCGFDVPRNLAQTAVEKLLRARRTSSRHQARCCLVQEHLSGQKQTCSRVWRDTGTASFEGKAASSSVWKNPGFIEKTHWAGFFRGLLGFFGFYGFYRVFWIFCFEFNFYLTKRFCHGATKFQLSFFLSKYIAFYAETMIWTCESDQSKLICMTFAWYLVEKTVF